MFDMGARFLWWMDPVDQIWVTCGMGNYTYIDMEVGKGYEVEFRKATNYTFCGMPGAMIRYDELGFDATPGAGEVDSLSASVDEATGSVTLYWTQPAGITPEHKYYVLRSSTRDGFWGTQGRDFYQLAILDFNVLTYQDNGIITADSELYYMIIPVNMSSGKCETGAYSIGVWTAGYLAGYDTMGLPLELAQSHSADWYCDNIPNTVGINYYQTSERRWAWHSTRMPQGAYDPMLVMAEGYQISTSGSTKHTFVGR